MVALALTIDRPSTAHAGAATGAATEWTQLLNNSELVTLVGQSSEQVRNQLTQITQLAEQIQNQMMIYQNMLQNTARLPHQVWGQAESDLRRLRDLVAEGQGIAFSMGHADDLLRQRFASFSDIETSLAGGEDFSSAYRSWSDTNRDTITGTLRAASLTADHFDSEEQTMKELRTMSETADGQMKALQVGHQLAAQQVAQMQKLRGLVSQQMVMVGTWLQTRQTEKDLAQTRRQRFFAPLGRGIPAGQKMEPRW
ncbi:P-type conjugative transfer protein TrbJ [Pseudorhizobium tarimense]|uniref:P-type conjugative transfer protein TrbJ n=1 Tax=Pseudorhizobium tarimense TaxID=1079109 RepID=A0ABV2HBY9_9HYPH|nr:P-type conjugative transfer protein TrbJ [Pseudorhizobium tarimense]MCJ8521165.1 P-type conjugative transfer protein TrbJ [Pseudorhizobium tarimense]